MLITGCKDTEIYPTSRMGHDNFGKGSFYSFYIIYNPVLPGTTSNTPGFLYPSHFYMVILFLKTDREAIHPDDMMAVSQIKAHA